MIREDTIGKQRIFLGLSTDAWPGLGKEDVGTRLFLTDRKAIAWWDGDAWGPATPGWFTLYQANPFVSRVSLNDATDDDFQTIHAVNIPPDLLPLSGSLRIWHWWLCTSSGNTKAISAQINGAAFAAPTTTTNVQLAQSNVVYLNGAPNIVIGMNNSNDIGATANTPLNLVNTDFSKAMPIEWKCRWTTQPIAGAEVITLQRVCVELYQ